MNRDEFVKMMGRAIGEADNPQIDDSETGDYFWEKYAPHYCGIAASVLAKIQAAGLAVVPVEATEAMIDGFGRRWRSDLGSGDGTLFPKHQRGELVWKTSLPRHD